MILSLPSKQNTDESHTKLNLLKLETRRKLHLVQTAHWMAQKKENLDTRKLPTRAHAEGRKIITMNTPRQDLYAKSFRYKAANYWNCLPTCIHMLTQTEKDKHLLKKHVLTWISLNP